MKSIMQSATSALAALALLRCGADAMCTRSRLPPSASEGALIVEGERGCVEFSICLGSTAGDFVTLNVSSSNKPPQSITVLYGSRIYSSSIYSLQVYSTSGFFNLRVAGDFLGRAPPKDSMLAHQQLRIAYTCSLVGTPRERAKAYEQAEAAVSLRMMAWLFLLFYIGRWARRMRTGLGWRYGPHSIRSRLYRQLYEEEEAASHALANLPLVPYSELRTPRAPEATAAADPPSADPGPARECGICLDDFADDQVLRLLPCHHYFHPQCIDKWFATCAYGSRPCPLCKADTLAGTGAAPRLYELAEIARERAALTA